VTSQLPAVAATIDNGLFGRRLVVVLAVLTVIAAVVLAAFAWDGSERFDAAVSLGDTSSYIHLAHAIARGELPPSRRTVGYPLFLAAAYALGGQTYGLHVAVAGQMLLLVLMAGMTAGLMRRLLPELPRWLHVLAVVLVFWMGLGHALFIMSDLLGAFLWLGMVYAVLTRGGWRWALASCLCSMAAVLVRPSFGPVLATIPVLIWAARKLSPRPTSWLAAVLLLAFGVGGWAMNARQESLHRDTVAQGLGEPFLAPHLALALQSNLYGTTDWDVYVPQFQQAVATAGNKPFDQMTRGEQDRYAKQVFLAEAKEHTGALGMAYVRNFAKYLLAPPETLSGNIAWLLDRRDDYDRGVVRLALTILWAPLWVAALFPSGASSARRRLYALMLTSLALLLLPAALVGGGGDRIKLPVYGLIVPMAAANLHAMIIRIGRGRRRRLCGQANQPSAQDTKEVL
jgi:hypothetical protein